MTKAQKEIILKWSKLRTPDGNYKKFAKTAMDYYQTLDKKDGQAMLDEFSDYIRKVKSGIITASPIEIHIPRL